MTLGNSPETEVKTVSLKDKIAAAKKALDEKNANKSGGQQELPVSAEQTSDSFEDDVPDYGPDEEKTGYNPSDEDKVIDAYIKNISIVDAYNRWCGKSVPKADGRTEGIMVSCPNPAHNDEKASAWLNTEKNVYTCGPCGFEGGDIYYLAAYHYGYNVPYFKKDGSFRKLKLQMAEELGFTVVHGVAQTYLVAPDAEFTEIPRQRENSENNEGNPSPSEEASNNNSASTESSNATPQESNNPEPEKVDFVSPTIDWRNVAPRGTFLYDWLSANVKDDCPEEYHFWTGMMALGFAAGRNRRLWDGRPITGNLFVCLSGPSGTGKSIAKERLANVMRLSMPYRDNAVINNGVKQIKAPASAEYLVHAFTLYEDDPTSNSKLYYPVRGYVDYEELSTLMAMASRLGNPLKPMLMDLFDSREEVSTGSIASGARYAKAENPFCGVMATTQFESLRDLLKRGDDGSGFINRWIFASGKAKPRRALGGEIIDLTGVSKSLMNVRQWCGTDEKLIEWTSEAVDAWTNFFHEKVVPLQEQSERAGIAMLGRIDLMLKKFILLFAINSMEERVSEDSVYRALQLFDYVRQTYGVVFKQMSRTEANDIKDEVLRQIKRLTAKHGGRAPSKREIYQTMQRKIGSDKILVDTLANLVKLEVIEEIVIKPASGRPTTRYAYHG